MTTETKRGCGFRKVGGLYLMGEGLTLGCDLLPFNVETCPCCDAGIKYSRGWKWIVPDKMFFGAKDCVNINCVKDKCPMRSEERSGLLWVGDRFYSPESFILEANTMGISKRIGAIPREFEIGKTWVFLAHIKAGIKSGKKVPAIFYVFCPTRIEKVITESQSKNTDEMLKLQRRGITPFVVPDDDRDHRGNVYDDQKKHQKSLFEE